MRFNNVIFKYEEADFFLEKLKNSSNSLKESSYYFSAFLSASNSVIESIRKSFSHHKLFQDWWNFQKQKFNHLSNSNFFKKARNINTHEGFQILDGGSASYQNGKEKIELYFSGFEESVNLKPIKKDLISESEKFMQVLTSFIWDAIVTFGKEIDPYYSKTQEYLKSYDDKDDILLKLYHEDQDPNISEESTSYTLNHEVDELLEKYLNINRFK